MTERNILWELDIRRQQKEWLLARFAYLYERAICFYNKGYTLKDPRVEALNHILYYCYRQCEDNGLAEDAKQIVREGRRERIVS